ncbi:UDP-glucose 6-dehydrogenase [Candidatus Magnetomoraceae bacterium gMMP-15]
MNISVIGLGKLGLCTAACFASKGHQVIGVDNNHYILESLDSKKCPINENGLEELLQKAWHYLTITDSVEYAVLNSEITLIIVPTPGQPDGKFTNQYVENVLKDIAPALQKKHSFHIVDVVSTVMPGSCDKIFKPLIEELSCKVCGKDFGLVYNPEFIALGSVIKDFLNPDLVLIGASDEPSAEIVKNLYFTMCDNSPDVAVMSLINAEITKLSLNCFVTMKISFANELASICEKISGANIDTITNALGLDTRIGAKYLKGGLGFGGTCFPRDNLAFQAFASDAGMKAKLGAAVVAINNSVINRLLNIICKNTNAGEKVALFGLSYKPGTHIVEESQSIMLARKLIEKNYTVSVHDPKALKNAKDLLGETVSYHDDPYICAKDTSAIVLLTNWLIYNQIDWKQICKSAKNDAIVLDSWRILKNIKLDKLRVISLGIGYDF